MGAFGVVDWEAIGLNAPGGPSDRFAWSSDALLGGLGFVDETQPAS